MLRIKKYTMINKHNMIRFLKTFVYDDYDDFDTCNKLQTIKYAICYFFLYMKKYLDINIIKQDTNHSDINYQIVKENFTETWFFTCKDMIIIYITQDEISEFYNKYISSYNYKFVIYRQFDYYIAFCVSHKSNELIDCLNFLVNNYYDPKYLLFSCFLKKPNLPLYQDLNPTTILQESTPISFIILNHNYKHKLNNIENIDIGNTSNTIQFYTTVGKGEENPILLNLIKVILNLLQSSTYLPVNYFI